MLKFLADENFNRDIVRGLRRRNPAVDIVRVQEVGLYSAEDPEILAWAARERRALLTHDAATMTRFAYERVVSGESMPGVFEIDTHAPIGRTIEEIHLLATCSLEEEWEGQVQYLPLKR